MVKNTKTPKKRNKTIIYFSLIVLGFLLSSCQPISIDDSVSPTGKEWYNTTGNFTGSTNLVSILDAANEYTFNWWGTLTLVSLFLVLFFIFKQPYETRDALLGSSFITTIVAVFMKIINLTGEWILLFFIVLTAGTLVSTFYDGF